MASSSRQKINKETVALSDTINQMDLTDIYGNIPPKKARIHIFSSIHRTFSRTDDMLGHKAVSINLR